MCARTNALQRQLLPTGFYYLNYKIQTRLQAPEVTDATASPDPARPGQPLRMTMRLDNVDPADPPMLTVFFSFDGATSWRAASAEFNAEDKAFTAFVPVPADAGSVQWFVRAVSADDNTYTEIPCAVAHFPFEKSDCLAPLSSETTYADYEDFSAEPSLDIVSTRAGYDDRFLYFEMETAAPVTYDKRDRLSMYSYYIGIYDPGAWTRLDPMDNVAFLFYTPWVFAKNSCVIYRRMGKYWEPDADSVTCHLDGNRLMFRAEKLAPFRLRDLYT